MISFACSSCGKALQVKDEQAGKKGKCPGCGQQLAIPQPVASPLKPGLAAAEERTLPPGNRGQAGQESLAEAGRQTGLGQGRKGEATRSYQPQGTSPELWDFLAPAEQPDEIGRLGPYRVLQILGTGGMGVVFRAEDPHLERLVALKAMLPSMAGSPGARERFFREAKAAAALKHPHIVSIFQVGEDRGAPFLAMEYLEGEPLDERLKRETRLPVPEILRIGREIAEGLEAAHEKGLIHRDVKPANIWLEGKKGQVKILDFGLARALGDTTHLTQSGAIIGTPAYMAPEQAGGNQVDGRCDLFSLGCVLYCLCTGERPFKGNDTMSILMALAMNTPPSPVSLNPGVPTELSELVMQLLAKKPEERLESARAVVQALQEIETQATAVQARVGTRAAVDPWAALQDGEVPVAAAPARPVVPTRKANSSNTARTEAVPQPAKQRAKPRSRRPWLFAVGGMGGVLLLGLVVLLFSRGSGPRPQKADQGQARQQDKGKELVKGEPKKVEPSPVGWNTSKPGAISTNSLGMKFAYVPRGRFWMGGGGGTPGEKEVTIPHDFFLGVYKVTQKDWQDLMSSNPSHFSRNGPGKDKVKDIPDAELLQFPVEMVSWDDTQEFLKKLNAKEKVSGFLYRLPTEAEWEYSCRGGASSKQACSFNYYFTEPTNDLSSDDANFGNKLQRTTKVGSYKPNRLGLYDMHGNVWEWTDSFLQEGASRRVLRGGSWDPYGSNCQAAYRYGYEPSNRIGSLGCRLARVPVGQ